MAFKFSTLKIGGTDYERSPEGLAAGRKFATERLVGNVDPESGVRTGLQNTLRRSELSDLMHQGLAKIDAIPDLALAAIPEQEGRTKSSITGETNAETGKRIKDTLAIDFILALTRMEKLSYGQFKEGEQQIPPEQAMHPERGENFLGNFYNCAMSQGLLTSHKNDNKFSTYPDTPNKGDAALLIQALDDVTNIATKYYGTLCEDRTDAMSKVEKRKFNGAPEMESFKALMAIADKPSEIPQSVSTQPTQKPTGPSQAKTLGC